MNGVAASPAQLGSEIAALAFADQLMTFFGTISGVETWASTIVQRHLTGLRFDTEPDTRLASQHRKSFGSRPKRSEHPGAMATSAQPPAAAKGPRERCSTRGRVTFANDLLAQPEEFR
jgi:hypothetical protein